MPLEAAFTLKECAGADVGAGGGAGGGAWPGSWPVTAVVPLPRDSNHAGTGGFALSRRGPGGAWTQVPAQFEAMERWWRDGRVRHVLVHFAGEVDAFTGPGTGVAEYRVTEGAPLSPAEPVVVTVPAAAADPIVVRTGSFVVRVHRAPFRIETPAGDLTASVRVAPGGAASAVQRSFDRPVGEIEVRVEETGPMRAVIRAEAPTVLTRAAGAADGAITAHRHGWALRLHVYAGTTFVKLDFQLQNSPVTAVRPAPFTFLSAGLEIAGAGPAGPATGRPDVVCAANVAATVRRFAQMGPTALSAAGGTLSVSLFPAGAFPAGMSSHWLDDMRHVTRETMFWFHGGAAAAAPLGAFADLFDRRPVAVVPTSWYAQTRSTLDLGGWIPSAAPRTAVPPAPGDPEPPPPDVRVPPSRPESEGWDSWQMDRGRRLAANRGGQWPYGGSTAVLTGDPADVMEAEDRAWGELNCRPQWMARYRDARDWCSVTLFPRYGAQSWREDWGTNNSEAAFDARLSYPAGTSHRANPRDDAHGWTYHVFEAWLLTGNPWIRDWYLFMGQFRRFWLKAPVRTSESLPDRMTRTRGHFLAGCVHAYRVTGDPGMMPLVRDWIRGWVLGEGAHPPLDSLDPGTGFVNDVESPWFCSAFQVGFLARALIAVYEEADHRDVQEVAKEAIERTVLWNHRYGNFGFEVGSTTRAAARVATGKSNSYAFPMVEPQLWAAAELAADEAAHGGARQRWFTVGTRPTDVPTSEALRAHVAAYFARTPRDVGADDPSVLAALGLPAWTGGTDLWMARNHPVHGIDRGPFRWPDGPTMTRWSGGWRPEPTGGTDAADGRPATSEKEFSLYGRFSERFHAAGSLAGYVPAEVRTTARPATPPSVDPALWDAADLLGIAGVVPCGAPGPVAGGPGSGGGTTGGGGAPPPAGTPSGGGTPAGGTPSGGGTPAGGGTPPGGGAPVGGGTPSGATRVTEDRTYAVALPHAYDIGAKILFAAKPAYGVDPAAAGGHRVALVPNPALRKKKTAKWILEHPVLRPPAYRVAGAGPAGRRCRVEIRRVVPATTWPMAPGDGGMPTALPDAADGGADGVLYVWSDGTFNVTARPNAALVNKFRMLVPDFTRVPNVFGEAEDAGYQPTVLTVTLRRDGTRDAAGVVTLDTPFPDSVVAEVQPPPTQPVVVYRGVYPGNVRVTETPIATSPTPPPAWLR